MSQKMEGSFLLFYCWFGWSAHPIALAWEPLVFLEFLEKKALAAEWKEVVFWLGAALLTVWKKKKGEARALYVFCHKSSVWMEKRPMALYFRMWINIASVDFVWCYMYNMIVHLIYEIYIFYFGLLDTTIFMWNGMRSDAPLLWGTFFLSFFVHFGSWVVQPSLGMVPRASYLHLAFRQRFGRCLSLTPGKIPSTMAKL